MLLGMFTPWLLLGMFAHMMFVTRDFTHMMFVTRDVYPMVVTRDVYPHDICY